MAFKVPSSPKTQTLSIDSFKGVDFSNNATQVALGRSPDAVNMISNLAGFPVKRYGYELVRDYRTRINGIFRIIDGEEKILVHAGIKLYDWLGTEIYSGMNDARSVSFEMDSKLWILDGKEYLVYGKFDGTFQLKKVSDMAFVPTTSISRDPSGGGTSYEPVNLVSKKRKNTFVVTSSYATTTSFQLDTRDLDADLVTAKILNASGEWIAKTENIDFTVNRTTGVVTFSVAPGISPILGRDNVEIQFSKTVASYAQRINKCTTFGIYGIGGTDNRVFLTGNEDMRNYDWFSAVNDPSYIGDLNYSQIGQISSAIIGYRKIGEFMSIHKEDNQQDATVFLRSGTLSSDNKPIFTVKQGVVGVGAVSKYAFANLRDDPLFLSKQGVNAVQTNQITGDRFAQDRSYYVNERLTKESNLESAVAIEYDNYYMLAINGHVYIADSRQKTYEKNAKNESFQYEWYYWDNVDARVWFERNGLYFGDSLGRLCYFNSKHVDIDVPVKAYWTTPLITFGSILYYKTIKQLSLMLNPYRRTSVDIFYRIRSIDTLIKNANADVFDFTDIDFERFTFNTDSSPRIIVTNRKAKKFMSAQFRFSNYKDDPFGFYQLAISYVINSKYKGGK